MKRILDQMKQTIQNQLQRSMVTTASKWAETYRVMGPPFSGPWTHNYHPWLIDMADAEEEVLIGQKASQMGFSEWAINSAFFNIDVNHLKVLYLMPTSDDANDFSDDRFDPAVQFSPHIAGLFTNTNNKQLKSGPYGSLYIRGSRSASRIKSIDTGLIILDEVNEMEERAIELVRKRFSGQTSFREMQLSTPTVPGVGISRSFDLSTQDEFHFRCPSCGKLTYLKFPESLVITGEDVHDKSLCNSHFICLLCKSKLPIWIPHPDDYEQSIPYEGIIPKGSRREFRKPWLQHKHRGGTSHMVPAYEGRDWRGFHVNCFYSAAMAGDPVYMAKEIIMSRYNDEKKQEVWNSGAGLPVITEGAKLEPNEVESCIRPADAYTGSDIITLGSDVGATGHVTIKEWYPISGVGPTFKPNDAFFPRTIAQIELKSSEGDFWKRLAQVYGDFKCIGGAVDRGPEIHGSAQFTMIDPDHIARVQYNHNLEAKTVTYDEIDRTLKVNRTAWLDHHFARFRAGKIALIAEEMHPDYVFHQCNLVRVLKKKKIPNSDEKVSYYAYENTGPDHFAHSDVYSELALPFALKAKRSVSDVLDFF